MQEINKQDSRNTPVFTISVAARQLQISVHTLRLYEKEGLILPYKKNSGHRLYSQTDLERIRFLRQLINHEKISINAIKLLFSILPCWIINSCVEEERMHCECFVDEKNICWNSPSKSAACLAKSCRDCKVYTDYLECGKIKALIAGLSRTFYSTTSKQM